MKKGYFSNIENLTNKNKSFRKVLYTASHCQLVLMSLKPHEEIGLEVHDDGDQFFRFEKGEGKVIINNAEYLVRGGDAVIVPSGSKHNVVNTSDLDDLKLYTIYAPPHHLDGIERVTKEEAEKDSPEFAGQTTE